MNDDKPIQNVVDSLKACGGQHALYAIVVHERWILLVVAGGVLVPGVESIFASGANVLTKLLPQDRARMGPRGPTGGGGFGPAELAIPVWWRRKAES